MRASFRVHKPNVYAKSVATTVAAAGGTVEERVAEMVRAERAAPEVVFGRWQRARQSALSALRAADPGRPVEWVTGPVKPATLATIGLGRRRIWIWSVNTLSRPMPWRATSSSPM